MNDVLGIEDFYHIRVHCPPAYDPEFSNIIESLSDLFVITREGGHYCKVKHRHIRPHLHVYIQWLGGTHAKLRSEIKASCPDLEGNGSYSISGVKSTNILSYILKGNTIIHKHGYSDEYLKTIPEWLDPKEYFRSRVYTHIIKQREKYEAKPPTPHIVHHKYFYTRMCMDIANYCKTEDKWLRKNEYIQYAFHLGIISVCEYLERIL